MNMSFLDAWPVPCLSTCCHAQLQCKIYVKTTSWFKKDLVSYSKLQGSGSHLFGSRFFSSFANRSGYNFTIKFGSSSLISSIVSSSENSNAELVNFKSGNSDRSEWIQTNQLTCRGWFTVRWWCSSWLGFIEAMTEVVQLIFVLFWGLWFNGWICITFFRLWIRSEKLEWCSA